MSVRTRGGLCALTLALGNLTSRVALDEDAPKPSIRVAETEGVKVDERKTVHLELVGARGAPLELSIQSAFLDTSWWGRLLDHKAREDGEAPPRAATGTNADLGTLRDIHCVTPCTVELPVGGYGVHLMPRGSFGYLGPNGANQNLQLSDATDQKVELTYIDGTAYRRAGLWTVIGGILTSVGCLTVSSLSDNLNSTESHLLNGGAIAGLAAGFVGSFLMYNFDEATAKFQAPTLRTAMAGAQKGQ